MIPTRKIEWSEFSDKHKAYIRNAIKNKMSVAEGSIRSGKTIDHCIITAIELETHPDKFHLASGSTIGNAKLNIGTCNGFGLENLFRGRCRWGKYDGNECLYIYTQTGEKVVIFAGGGKSDSYKKILGNSYGLWIATEINEHFDSDDSRESFIKVALGRQVAAKKPKILWDLNPCSPGHRIYTDYIDKFKEGFVGGYNYEHFTLYDNKSITSDRLHELESMYVPGTIWYRRDLLGERCNAEGLIYQEYAENPKAYEIDSMTALDNILVTIGVDFGGNKSATTFVATGYTRNLRDVRCLYSERHEEKLNPELLNVIFHKFVENVYSIYKKVMECYCDSAEQVLINGMDTYSKKNQLPVFIRNAKKNPVNERIRLVDRLMAQGRFKVGTKAETVRKALSSAVWDKKKPDERLDDFTSDIDTLDAMEYSIEPYMNDLLRGI